MDELVERSTLFVVGIGSHARGDAGLKSDLDIFVGSKAFSWRLERCDGLLVSVSARPSSITASVRAVAEGAFRRALLARGAGCVRCG
jgi:predicted nucleotidyltransferase